MKLIEGYIFKSLFKTFLITLLLFLFLGLLTRIVHYAGIITEDGGGIKDLFLILLLVQPKIITALAPFIALISTFMVYYGLINSSEHIAIYNLGISEVGIVRPLFWFSGILVVILIFLSSVVVPFSYKKMEGIQNRIALSLSQSLVKQKDFVKHKGVIFFINEVLEDGKSNGIVFIDRRIPENEAFLIVDQGQVAFSGASILLDGEGVYLEKKTDLSPFPLKAIFKKYSSSLGISENYSKNSSNSLSYKNNGVVIKAFIAGDEDAAIELKSRLGWPLFAFLLPFAAAVCLLKMFNFSRSKISFKNVIVTITIITFIIFSGLFGGLAMNDSLFKFFLYYLNIFLIFLFLLFMLRSKVFR